MARTTALIVLDVVRPTIGPLVSKPGDRIVVRWWHRDRPVVVMRKGAGGWRPQRLADFNRDALRGWLLDGTLREVHVAPSGCTAVEMLGRCGTVPCASP